MILDGVPIHNGNTNNNDYWGNQRINSNGLVDINPEDIENISILKGAAASALYGSEAANGVVMITTKKGQKGTGTHVDFSANVSFDKVAYMPEIQKEFGPGYDNWALGDTQEAATGFRNTRFDRNGNNIVTPNREAIYTYGARYDSSKKVTYFDGTERSFTPIDHNQWEDIFRTGINQTYNLALTNSTDRNSLRFSYTYNDVQAMQYNSNNNKHNFNLNGSFDVTKTIKLNYAATFTSQYIKNRPYRISRLVQRQHNYAIVDEVDSVLIDDARTPLIISGPIPKGDDQMFEQYQPLVEKLYEVQRKQATELLAEAKQKINEGTKAKNQELLDEGFLALFRSYKALPKNKPLIKYLSEEGIKAGLLKTEEFYMANNNREMPKAAIPSSLAVTTS